MRSAAEAITQRGPDASGEYVGSGALLIHRRLSIIDPTSASDQPMTDVGGHRTIVFNGEIYNYRSLAPLARGDTRALLEAEQRGPEHLRGMFAYAVWDEGARELRLVRDPFGIKPLYFAQHGPRLYFGSSVVAVAAATGVTRINSQAVAQFLRYGSVWSEETLVSGIREVPPGSTITWRDGQIRCHAYWNLESTVLAGGAGPGLREALLDSVSAHMVADVPVGLFLSGGIDSTAVACAAKSAAQPPTAVTLALESSTHSELNAARATASLYGLPHQVVSSVGDVSTVLSALQSSDQPSIDGINTFLVSRALTALGLKVALSGLGADEIFGGYRQHKWMPILAAAARLSRRVPATVRSRTPARVRRLLAAHPSLEGVYAELRSIRPASQVARMCGRAPDPMPAPSDELPLHFKICELESRHYLRYTLLRDTDTFSMLNSLEVRVPFLDLYVLHAVSALSALTVVSRRKRLIVDALGDARLRKVSQAPKVGFSVPYLTWLESAAVRDRWDDLSAGPLASVVDLTAQSGTSAGPHHESAAARWSLIALDCWLREFHKVQSA